MPFGKPPAEPIYGKSITILFALAHRLSQDNNHLNLDNQALWDHSQQSHHLHLKLPLPQQTSSTLGTHGSGLLSYKHCSPIPTL